MIVNLYTNDEPNGTSEGLHRGIFTVTHENHVIAEDREYFEAAWMDAYRDVRTSLQGEPRRDYILDRLHGNGWKIEKITGTGQVWY